MGHGVRVEVVAGQDPSGNVYVVSNPHVEGMVKIGGTSGPVERRVDAMLTGTPGGELRIEGYAGVPDWRALEAALHHRFRRQRVKGSEWFRVPAKEALRAVEAESRRLWPRAQVGRRRDSRNASPLWGWVLIGLAIWFALAISG